MEVRVFVMRAFVQLRDLLSTHKTLAKHLGELEKRITGHDKDIAQIINTIHQLLEPPPEKNKRPNRGRVGSIAPIRNNAYNTHTMQLMQ